MNGWEEERRAGVAAVVEEDLVEDCKSRAKRGEGGARI